MALEAAFADLTAQLNGLHGLLEGLSLTTGVDRSERESPMLVDSMHDSVVELQDWLKNALAEAVKAEKAVGPRIDLNRARRQLAASQEAYQQLSEAISVNMLPYDRVAELLQFGKENGSQWSKWANTVWQWLERFPNQLQAVARAYFRAWQELAERAGSSAVSVQSTSIGQQITARAPAEKEYEVEGLT